MSPDRANDVDSEAPAVTKKQVGVSSVATEGMTEVGLSLKEIVLFTRFWCQNMSP